MKPKQVFDTLEAFALLVKEIHALRESNKQLNDYVSSLESDVNHHLQENKGLKAEIKELEERFESVNHLANLHLKCLEQVREENESLKEENKSLKDDRDELLEQLKKETAPFEKQVTRLMLENRRLTKQLEESYELHALKGELQKELKEQTDISPKLEIKGGGEFKISERPHPLAQKQEDSIRKSGRGF